MTYEEAVLHLRGIPEHSQLMYDAYLTEDLTECAQRFADSPEFAQALSLLGGHAQGVVLDLGAGNGIASYAFARAGACQTVALEPDASEVVGAGAIRKLVRRTGVSIEVLAAYGEAIPLVDNSVDVVYARQVLHHARNLDQVLAECARVLRPGGIFLACREHVAMNERQLAAFLASHPIHQLTGSEHAYPLETYLSAIEGASLRVLEVLEPWGSLINAFPAVSTQAEMLAYPSLLLRRRFGRLGQVLSLLPPARALVLWRLNRGVPGCLYSFLATKPWDANPD